MLTAPLVSWSQDGGRSRAFVSISPLAYFVERIGGASVEVGVLVPPGRSPETFEPTPGQLAGLADATVLFTVGMPFEKALVAKLASTHPGLKVVDTRAGIELRRMKEVHAHQGLDEEGEFDPHIWLDPWRVKIMAGTICEGLAAIDPRHADHFRQNLERFRNDLDALDAKIAEALAPFKGRGFYVFHPSFGYFADRYGLRQVAVEAEGKEPGPKQLAGLIEQARREGVKVIFAQPQFPRSGAKAIAREIGGEVIPLDPLARDYVRNLETMAGKLRQALSQGESPAGKS